MSIGDLVHDYALGKYGIIVGDSFIEEEDQRGASHPMNWEWLVFYDDGDLIGADTSDLKVINGSK
jgi:hypothetical protein